MASKLKSKELISSSGGSDDGESTEEISKTKTKAKRHTKEDEPKSKKQKVSTSKENEDINVFQLSVNRFVTINSFKGKPKIDIREFYYDNVGESKPGKKGISLSIEQWKMLKQFIPKIDEVLESMS